MTDSRHLTILSITEVQLMANGTCSAADVTCAIVAEEKKEIVERRIIIRCSLYRSMLFCTHRIPARAEYVFMHGSGGFVRFAIDFDM